MLIMPGLATRSGARLFFVGVLVAAMLGCGSFPEEVRSFDAGTGIELSSTPFFPQEQFQCGPAALATVLVASGVAVDEDALAKQVYIPAQQGSIRSEMIAAVRRNERLPYEISRSLGAVMAELRAGRPVLILQNLGISWYPRWHYAVVIGYDSDTDDWLLRSGTDRVRRTPTRVLLHTWRRSNYWGIVTLRPDELPIEADPLRVARVITALEETGHSETALTAWRTLTAAYPDRATLLFGLANAELSDGNTHEAVRVLGLVIDLDPGLIAARNNLAMAQLILGQKALALATIREAIATAEGDQLASTLRETEAEILAAIGDDEPATDRRTGRGLP